MPWVGPPFSLAAKTLKQASAYARATARAARARPASAACEEEPVYAHLDLVLLGLAVSVEIPLGRVRERVDEDASDRLSDGVVDRPRFADC
jgi:hypothetical protein